MARSPTTRPLSRRLLLAGLGASAALGGVRGQGSGEPPVDVQLVLGVDASGSVSERRFQLQQQGYVDAFRNPRVIKAIQSGLTGGIAVTMYQWTGPRLQRPVFGWTRISDAASADALAGRLERSPRMLFGGGTSISGAIDYGANLFAACPFPSTRRVIDISGDGANTSGRMVTDARDEAVAKGIVINGLPILAIEFDLDRHFLEEVIGGPGAFMIAAKDFESFGEAIARKLVQEISALPSRAG
jgi:hypothetical protein